MKSLVEEQNQVSEFVILQDRFLVFPMKTGCEWRKVHVNCWQLVFEMMRVHAHTHRYKHTQFFLLENGFPPLPR